MPSPEEILSGLGEIANQWRALAIAWHVYFAILVAGLILGARPSKRIAGILLALPLFSVSVLAWAHANPFNGITFGLAAIALVGMAIRLPHTRTRIASAWAVTAGAFMLVFGWGYPHFLDTTSWAPYLYAAPTGLIPCPTLSIIIGLALIGDGLGSRAWSLVLAATGVFYGFFGAMRLNVVIDWTLLAGSVLLALAALRSSIEPSRNDRVQRVS